MKAATPSVLGKIRRIPQLWLELSTPLDSIRMTFGERGFFAYSVSDKGEVWWFNNYFRAQSGHQPRVEKFIKRARKVGDTKTKTNPIAAWFRDRLIGFFIGKHIKQLDWIYGWTYPK